MIDLVIIENEEVPKTTLEWHQKEIPFNTVFYIAKGPNPFSGQFIGTLVYVNSDDLESRYHYLDKKGKECSTWHSNLKKVPRKYRSQAVFLQYRLYEHTMRAKYIDTLEIPFMSEKDLREAILSDDRIARIRTGIAPLYESPIVSFKGSV